MDSGWFLGSPIVSLDYAATLERWLRKQALANTLPDVLVLSGVPSWSRYASVVGLFLSTTYDLYALKRTERAVASLCGGWEGYLSRRSANFRRSLKKALKRSERAGWSMEWHEGRGLDHHTLYKRVLAIRVKELEGPNRLWALDRQYVGILSFGIAAVGTSRGFAPWFFDF